LSSVTPALLTRTSICPWAASADFTVSAMDSGSVMSRRTAEALPPAAAASATTFSSASPVRAAPRTIAPSPARRFAIAAPMPREAPVTRATLPSNRFMGRSLLLRLFRQVRQLAAPGLDDEPRGVGDGQDRGVVRGADRVDLAAVGQDGQDET